MSSQTIIKNSKTLRSYVNTFLRYLCHVTYWTSQRRDSCLGMTAEASIWATVGNEKGVAANGEPVKTRHKQ